MESKKKSLLSAALSSNFAEAGAGLNDQATQTKADTFAFPCLADANDVSTNGIAEEVEKMDLSKRQTLAGSAPTVPRLSSTMTDFELNPYSIRSGKEMLPTSLKDSKLSSNFLSEAVIGSLPKGLSLTEKELVFANTPLSPTRNLLNSLPSTIVGSRSMEGRRLRRHVLRGAVIVFITAGYSGKRFIFERAKELGVRSVIIDGPDSWSKTMQEEGVIERFIGLDMTDAETVFDRCLEGMIKVKKDFGELDGVVSFSEMAMPLVSRLAEKMGLPGNPPSAVDDARDKHATRGRMAEVGLPTPRNYLIEEVAQLEAASELVGYPAVIKPIYGAASIGVVRVDSFEDLRKAYARVTKEMAGARVVAGALIAAEDSDDDGDGDNGGEGGVKMKTAASGNAGSWIRMSIMMEEYLDGPEVDVDVVFSESQAVYGAVTDNWPTVEPYFLETGSNSPSILPSYQQRELLELSVKTVEALGFISGVFHVEGKYTSRGPRLIEVNCRMGGGPVRTMNQLVWGVDLVEEQLLCSAGIPCRPPVAAKPLVNIAEYSVNAMKTGILKNTDFLAQYQGIDDVLYARELIEPGSKVVGAKDGLPTWVCELMVTKPSVDDAIAFVKKMEEDIQAAIVIDPLPAKQQQQQQ